jgi:hypothetical protein
MVDMRNVKTQGVPIMTLTLDDSENGFFAIASCTIGLYLFSFFFVLLTVISLRLFVNDSNTTRCNQLVTILLTTLEKVTTWELGSGELSV